MDTIFAVATAPGKAGVSIVRVSGPDAFAGCIILAGIMPTPRKTTLRVLKGSNGDPLDQAMIIAFEKGASFTGEDVVEYHLHGSRAVVSAVMFELAQLPGHRLAEAGEFTRRALENERLDLAQIEGLADLIDAETEAQRLQALRVLSGALGDQVEIWRSKLIRAAALLEATIDFADEDVPVDVTPEVRQLLDHVGNDLGREIIGSQLAERVTDGFEVAIVGPPNIGKSTLLNALAGRDAAIISDIPGTTRDVIEARMDLKGLPVTFLDTAGIRHSDDVVESIGIARAKERAKNADLRVFLLQAEADKTDIEVLSDDLVLIGKSDNNNSKSGISGLTGYGIDKLLQHVSEVLSTRAQRAGVTTKERHRVAMIEAKEHLAKGIHLLNHGPDVYELVTEELRIAARSLDSLLGRVDVEDILDEIFSSFCLGK